PAAEDAWIELSTEKGLSRWKALKGWELADSVELNAKESRKLTFTPGKGILVNGARGRAPDLVTQESFGDVEVHVEFLISKRSNSGVKSQAVYEIQITDSHGKKDKDLTGDDCGGIYPRAELLPRYRYLDKGIAPRVNAALPAGQWQTLDAVFLSPRFDTSGK